MSLICLRLILRVIDIDDLYQVRDDMNPTGWARYYAHRLDMALTIEHFVRGWVEREMAEWSERGCFLGWIERERVLHVIRGWMERGEGAFLCTWLGGPMGGVLHCVRVAAAPVCMHDKGQWCEFFLALDAVLPPPPDSS